MTDLAAQPVTGPQPGRKPGKEEKLYTARPWQLIWWRFARHRLAVASLVFLAVCYVVVLFAEFFAPYRPFDIDKLQTYRPPQAIHFFDKGVFQGPFVYGLKRSRDPETAQVLYAVDPDKIMPVRFFVEGPGYDLWGLVPMKLHLFGLDEPKQRLTLLGTDLLGRDVFSRLVHGGRVTLSAGLVGVVFSFVIGLTMGAISGYRGGMTDAAIQRLMEFIRSVPTIPLWMGLAAALPIEWDPLFVYILITIILSLVGWTHLARVVRGRFLQIRNEDFILAARLSSASETRIIVRHMLPAMTSYIIAAMTLAVPEMILGETALSFLGLGLRPPVVSWGVLLQEAQNLRSISLAPWLLSPGIAVVLVVLAFNFLGDGLRDAADPYDR
jgi:peptide/nickel transport system permease protein